MYHNLTLAHAMQTGWVDAFGRKKKQMCPPGESKHLKRAFCLVSKVSKAQLFAAILTSSRNGTVWSSNHLRQTQANNCCKHAMLNRQLPMSALCKFDSNLS